MNLSGAAAKPLAGENDLAQNPFDLDAEYGPSLFDARHRFVASASWKPRSPIARRAAVRAIFGGWQVNAIATHNSGTPFTVSDSANVALQANSPPISGFPASRPERGRRSERRAAHRRRVAQPLGVPAPERPDAGRSVRQRRPQHRARPVVHERRPVARPRLRLSGEARLQFRAEVFNVANHANFGLPVADLNSANFGRIFSAGPPRLMQFALKLIF